MQGYLNNFLDLLPNRGVAIVFLVGWTIVVVAIKNVIWRILGRIAKKSTSNFDDNLVRTTKFPMTLIVIATGFLLLEPIFDFTHRWLNIASVILITIALGIFIDRLLRAAIKNYGEKKTGFRHYSHVAQTLIRIIILVLAALIIIDAFGLSITPLVASLGVGSVAIALALQDTLSNYFSGIYLVIDQPIHVGDFIRLESGEEGFVEAVSWRSTRIRKLPNHILIIPNNKLAASMITNYDLPVQELSVLVQVGVHYDSDLEQVERVTIEVGREVMKSVTGAVPGHEPFIRYHTFDDSSINFSVILRAKTFVDNYLIKHEFIKRLQKRYKEEGIIIPFPIRTVYMKNN